MVEHGKLAEELFFRGYNCAQCIAVAFCDVTGMDERAAARISSSFGGGMGRMREVCGAVSGMLLVAGILYGYHTPGDDRVKAEHYRLVQELSGEFRRQNGSIICRELLGNPASDPNPTPRTAEFYASRPCGAYIRAAANILDAYIKAHPLGAE